MTTKNSFKGVLACALLLASSTVLANDCKYAIQKTDPDTGLQNLATKRVGVSTMMATNSSAIQAVSIGGEKFLAVRLHAVNRFPVPPELNINVNGGSQQYRTGKYDVRLDDVLTQLKKDAAFVPAGSTLRITLEDRSIMVLNSDKDAWSRSSGQKPKFDGNESPNFVIASTVSAMYRLDADAIKALTSRLAISMRMETAERYYEFASRMNVQYPLTWGKKNGQQLQEALNCVL